MTFSLRGCWLTATLCLVFALLPGCSSETIDEIKNKVGAGVDQVKQAGQDAGEKVGDQVAAANTFLKLEMGEAVNVKACFASLTKLPGSRPAVLQLASYADAERESFPSVKIWAEVASSQPDSLVGQSVKAQIYVQTKADGVVWQSAANEPIELRITKAGATEVAGEITSGKLVSSDGGKGVELRGTFGGALR